MAYEDVVTQLRNHSNLSQGAEDRSLLYELWKADQAGVPPDLARHVENILACLAVANLELNGPRPSETFDLQNPRVISDLAYPVSSVVVGLLQSHRRWSTSGGYPATALDALRDAARCIAMAWDMVLAGDHDDLIAELELEWDAAV